MFYVSECDHVGVDLYTPAREAVKHLYDVGCRRIAYVLDDPSRAQGEPRYEAYTSVMQEAGLPAEFLPLHGASQAEVRRLVKEYIQEHAVPDGLFCHTEKLRETYAVNHYATAPWVILKDYAPDMMNPYISWSANGAPMAKFSTPANLITVLEFYGTCPDVRNANHNMDCGIHNRGSNYIFMDGHAKWLRVMQTLNPDSTCMWADGGDPNAQIKICTAYRNKILYHGSTGAQRCREQCL